MNNKTIIIRPHFVYVFTLLYPYLSLLIIPVIRGVYRYLAGKSSTFSAFLTAEVVMLCIAFFAAVLKLKRTKITVSNHIKVEKGLIFKVRYTVPQTASRVFMLESDPFLRLIGVYRLKIYTEAGNRAKPDERLPISKSTATELYRQLMVEGQAVKSNTLGNVIMSAALSSSMAGFLLAAPLVKSVASLLGNGLTAVLPKLRSQSFSVDDLETLSKALPLLVFVGYIVSFAVILLRNSGFSSIKNGDKIMLDSGRLPHRTAFLEVLSVNSIKTVTAPLMRLANKCAVKFSACGFGRAKGEIGLLLPCVRTTLADGLTRWLLPQFKELKTSIKPDRRAIKRCAFLPLIFMALTLLSAMITYRLFPKLHSVIITLALLVFVIILLWLIARITVLLKGEVSVDVNAYSLTGRYGFGTVKLQCDKRNVESITVRRTPFDYRYRHCTVILRTSYKNHDSVKLKYLNYDKVCELLELGIE